MAYVKRECKKSLEESSIFKFWEYLQILLHVLYHFKHIFKSVILKHVLVWTPHTIFISRQLPQNITIFEGNVCLLWQNNCLAVCYTTLPPIRIEDKILEVGSLLQVTNSLDYSHIMWINSQRRFIFLVSLLEFYVLIAKPCDL